MVIEYLQRKKVNSIIIVKYIFFTGLLAGTLDISAAFVNFFIVSDGKSPVIVLYFIASGVFGTFAFSGGIFYAICGLVFHFTIAYSFTTFYFFIYPKIYYYIKNKFLTGLLFGVLTWLVMNLVVVPLSNTPSHQYSIFQLILSVLFLIFFIGLPASISADMFYSKKKDSNTVP